MIKEAIKEYLKFFRGLMIIFAAVLLFGLGVIVYFEVKSKAAYYDSSNTERVTEERVFDYADVLTEREENKLRKLIARREKMTQCDIVLVTLNESLADYAPEYRALYGYTISPDEYVMVYSDKFWEDNKFGYNSPLSLDGSSYSGDGVILVDNIYEEAPWGYKYTWLGTQGKVERKYTNAMINHLLDVVYVKIDSNPYRAYKAYINTFTMDMLGSNLTQINVFATWPWVVTLIVVLIFIFSNLAQKAGEVTVNKQTYLVGKKADFPVCEDVFLRKHVTKTARVETSSGSGGGRSSFGGGSHQGGGGHHVSGGGGSHGGGGHHR